MTLWGDWVIHGVALEAGFQRSGGQLGEMMLTFLFRFFARGSGSLISSAGLFVDAEWSCALAALVLLRVVGRELIG
jgi:hypothetical protein